MPTNEERDDLNPSLKQVLELKRDKNNVTTLSTKFKNIADEVNKLLKPLGLEMKKNPIQAESPYTAALKNPTAANQLANQLNNNPALLALGQALLDKMGQTPNAQQKSTLPNPFNMNIPKNTPSGK